MNKEKRIAVFYYEGFAEFEISLALLYLNKYEIISVAMEKKEYRSLSGQRFIVDFLLDEIDPSTIALFIIPGGDPNPYLANQRLFQFINKIIDHGAIIAGICGGADILVSMDYFIDKPCTGNPHDPNNPQQLIDSFAKTKYTNQPVVISGNLITAQGSAFIEFASVLTKQMKLSKNEIPNLNFNWLQSINYWTDVSESIKVSTSTFEECNVSIIISKGEALLVDTGYRLKEAQRALQFINDQRLKIKGIVLTHFHEDHIANLSMFQKDDTILYDPSNVTDEQYLTIGDKKIRLFKTPGHHIKGDISVEVIDEHILLSGDILFSCLPPQLCYGAQFKQLKNSIELIAKEHYHWIIPGHGRVTKGDEITSMSLEYIHNLEKFITETVKNKGSIDDLQYCNLEDCISHYDWLVIEPSIDLHRQNKEELYLELNKK